MTPWILAVLSLFVVQTLVPPALRYLFAGPGVGNRLRVALGPRDDPPPLSPMAARAQRALANMHEALPVFLAVALLLSQRRWLPPSATRGAMVFFLARAVYVPAYLSGVPGVRSAVWVVSWVGLAMMLVALAG